MSFIAACLNNDDTTARKLMFEMDENTLIKGLTATIENFNFGLAETILSTLKCEPNSTQKVDLSELLRKAYSYKHPKIANFILDPNTLKALTDKNLSKCLSTALEKGETDGAEKIYVEIQARNLVQKMEWDRAMFLSCSANQPKSVNFLISKGVTDWDAGLMGACFEDRKELFQLMLSKGATRCQCGRLPKEHTKLL